MERRVLPQARGNARASRLGARLALGATRRFRRCVAAAPLSAQAAAPAACAALQEKYPDWKGKTLVNAINPHTPGYETIDPKDPEQIYRLRHRSRRSHRRMPRLQADLQAGDVRGTAHHARRAARRTSSSPTSTPPRSAPRPPTSSPIRKCSTACWSPRAIRRGINGINMSMCGAAAAENTGYVEVPLIQALMPGMQEGRQGRADHPALRQQRQLHPGDPRRPRRHLCQRRQHRRQRGQGLSGQAGEGDRGDDPVFGRHRRARRTSRNSATPCWPR